MKKLCFLLLISSMLIISGCLTTTKTVDYVFEKVEYPPVFMISENSGKKDLAIVIVSQETYIKLLLKWISSALKIVDEEKNKKETEWIDNYVNITVDTN